MLSHSEQGSDSLCAVTMYRYITDYQPADEKVTNTIMNNHWRINKHHANDLIGTVINHGKADLWKGKGCICLRASYLEDQIQ